MLAAATEDRPWDIAIIGGGATGLGTALEAASRGYRTLLVEAADFAQATSSRSTKLIHGGVRYLQSGQISMVRESLRERGRLLRNAPHLVHPLKFVIPATSSWQRWYYLAGMKAYDLLAGDLQIGRSRSLAAAEVSQRLPTLKPERHRGGVLYSDGQFDDAHLALALARTSAEQGAVVVNYAPVIRLCHSQGKLDGMVVRDLESGHEWQIRARVVINATGVFYDEIARLDLPDSGNDSRRIVASQGTHLVLDRAALASEHAMLIPQTDDGRVLFAIPWLGATLIGTTDHQVEQVVKEPKPLKQELEYLLEHVGRYLNPAPQLHDIKAAFSGLRPLVAHNQSGTSTASMSREHQILISNSGMVSIIGGKWTTYRKMGEEVVQRAATLGDLPNRPSVTANLKLAGAHEELKDHQNPAGAYAQYSRELQDMAQRDPAVLKPLHPRYPLLRGHVVMAARYEMPRTLEDMLARRLRVLFFDVPAALEMASECCQLMASELGFSESWQTDQLTALKHSIEQYFPSELFG